MAEQQSPAEKTRKIVPLEHQTYSLYFALCGFVLVIVSLWAIWDETYSRRPWKITQQDFVKAARPAAQKRLQEAEASLDKVKKDDVNYFYARDLMQTRFPKGDKSFNESL